MDPEQPQPSTPAPARRSFKQTIFRNSIIVTFGSSLMRILNLGFTIAVVRMLGETGYGQYAAIVAFVGLFSVLFELGLSQYVEREIARDRDRVSELFGNLVVLRLLLATVGAAVIAGLALIIYRDPVFVAGTLFYTATFVPSALLAPLVVVMTANERFDLATSLQISGHVLSLVAGALVLAVGGGVLGLLGVGVVVMPVQILLAIWTIRRNRLGPLRLRIAPREWLPLIRTALPFGITSLALTFNFYADTVILSLFATAAVVGWYGVAYRLVFTLVSLADGFLQAATPSLAREHQHNPDDVRRWSQQSVEWMLVLSLPIAIGGTILAEHLLGLLYGAAFIPSAQVLRFIIWDVPLLLFCAFCGNLSTAVGRERYAAKIYAAAAAGNVLLNLLLIPIYGMLGATIVTLATDGFCMLAFGWLLRDQLRLGDSASRLGRVAACGGLMALTMMVTQALPFVLTGIIGSLVYGVAVIGTGAVDRGQLLRALRLRRFMRAGASA